MLIGPHFLLPALLRSSEVQLSTRVTEYQGAWSPLPICPLSVPIPSPLCLVCFCGTFARRNALSDLSPLLLAQILVLGQEPREGKHGC